NYSGGVGTVGPTDYYDEQMDDGSMTIENGNKLANSFKGYHGFDPIKTIKRMDIPVLCMYGALDRSHPGLFDLESLNK
ncbi:hypothetical protein, partial [Flagellimonas flava]|uniref:hypothetical protein n=1 Tax=Flagellimonas flava TaxID=570519 RepID=UPI003D64A4A1